MDLAKKLKTALDETRILILGSEILLGFGLRSFFTENFDRLPVHVRWLDAAALGLMVVVVGMLITPEPYHRIVERGRDSGAFHALVTDIADLALLPFALALGIDVFIAIEPVFGTVASAAAGAGATIVALALWYALPRAVRARTGRKERSMTELQRDEEANTPLHIRIEQLLTEARVILPGAQALLGFQLSIVLTQAFEQLPSASRITHAVSIGFVALTVMLLMAPAAYHRIVYAGEDAEGMHRTGSILVTAATLPLAIGLSSDLYVVMAKLAESGTVGCIAGVGCFAALLALWYAFPLAERARRNARLAAGGEARPKPQGQSG